jgi:hypothetical protein
MKTNFQTALMAHSNRSDVIQGQAIKLDNLGAKIALILNFWTA